MIVPVNDVKNAVHFTAAAWLVNCCLIMGWRTRTEPDKLRTNTQLTHSQSTEYKEGGEHSSRRPHNAATPQGHRKSPMWRVVNFTAATQLV